MLYKGGKCVRGSSVVSTKFMMDYIIKEILDRVVNEGDVRDREGDKLLVRDRDSRRPVDMAVYGSRDVRENGKMVLGGGKMKVQMGKFPKEGELGRRRGKDVCSVCMGTCCLAARDLVKNLVDIGEIRAILIFQLFLVLGPS